MPANRSARSPRPVSVCSFTFADGRQCRLPRRQGHPYLCLFHAKKEAQIFAGERAGQDIASFLNGSYISACDVASALARLFAAVAQGQIKPKTAATLAYLGQTLVQTLHLAQHEYINAFGTNSWRDTVRSSFTPTTNPQQPSPPPAPQTPPSEPRRPHAPEPAPTHSAQPDSTAVNTTSQPTPSPARSSAQHLSAGGAPQVSPARERRGAGRARPKRRRCDTNPRMYQRRPSLQLRGHNSFRMNTYKSV
jgi:outer membrane biosynthesis protein TonB